jgi:ferredoxin
MAREVSVDPDLCIGSGDCVARVLGGFLIDDGAGVSVPTSAVETASMDVVLAAAMGCPTQAIRVVEDGVVVHESNG